MRDLPPAQVHKQLAAQLDEMLAHAKGLEGQLAMVGRSPADDSALAFPGAKERLGAMMDAAFAQGSTGMALDIAGYTLHPWGFEPGQVQAKTLCLYGSQDPATGSRHGTWWQKNLPNARLEMVPGAGHLLVIPMWHRVLSFLAPRSK
jgi:pimeloyl-ACP methyl ester carboxylesterase